MSLRPVLMRSIATPFRRVALAATMVVAGVALIAAGPIAPSYHFVTYDAPGWDNTQIWGITNQGMLTGVAYNAFDTTNTGVIWLNGELRFVHHPGQGIGGTLLYGANQHGHVAGNYYDASGIAHAIIYETDRKTFVQLPDVPGATYNAAGAIADNGVVLGNFTTDPKQLTNYVGWLFADGKYHDFIEPKSDQPIFGTADYSMNNALTFVGYYEDAAGVAHGYIKPFGRPYIQRDVPVAGAKATYIVGINNQDVIAGEYLDAQGLNHGFVMDGGRFTSVDVPGANGTSIFAINDFGVIAGAWYNAAGNAHGFVGRPR